MLKFILSLIVLIGLINLGSRPIPVGDSNLPAVGSFFSPATGFWKNGDVPKPSNIDILSSENPIKIWMDERGVPHIFASSYLDAVRAQGYLHAQDRLFQMDVSSRFTAGRLSELFGARMLSIDKIMRRRGLPFAAENAIKGWKNHKNSWAIIEAYCEGVNSYIGQLKKCDYPIEYKLLDAPIEQWSPLKTALISKSMTFDLSFRNHDDIASKALDLVGPDMFKFLFPYRNPKNDPIIPPGSNWAIDSAQKLGTQYPSIPYGRPLNQKQELLPDEAIGSNNWAVNGSKTKSGAPILCSDPHLRLRLPSVWYEAQLHCPATNVYGVSLPGAPGIIIGFNEHIAWGVTNVGMDVLDWYKIKWKNKTRSTYLLDDEIKTVTKRVEQINVKNQKTVIDTILYTVWGPLTYSDDTSHYLYDHAMRWVGHDIQSSDELNCFVGLNFAKNIDDYLAATKEFRSPAQNIVFASRNQDIALRVSGAIPIRSKNQGKFTQDGSRKANGWKGFVPSSQNPNVINPPRNFVSSANQVSTDSTYPFPYFGYFADYRGRLLNKKLAQMSNITPQDMMALQQNDESLLANEALPLLLNSIKNVNSLSESAQQKIGKLNSWDKKFRANRLEPALFVSWFNHFYRMVWDEFNRPEIKANTPEFWRTLEILEHHPQHSYFDIVGTSHIENSADISALALERTVVELDSLILKDKDFNWGKYNGNTISHLLNLPAFSSDVNPVNGFKYALNATNATNGPSWRMVVELSDPVRAWGHYPGGQSGHPGHRFYDNMIEDWTNGNYYELKFLHSSADINNTSGQLITCNKK